MHFVSLGDYETFQLSKWVPTIEWGLKFEFRILNGVWTTAYLNVLGHGLMVERRKVDRFHVQLWEDGEVKCGKWTCYIEWISAWSQSTLGFRVPKLKREIASTWYQKLQVQEESLKIHWRFIITISP